VQLVHALHRHHALFAGTSNAPANTGQEARHARSRFNDHPDDHLSRPDTTIAEIERLMSEHRVRRIPIVDASGNPLGIVSLNDLAIASVRPGTTTQREPSTLAQTFAAICRHRSPDERAA
jgi:CBS-domain-containing membrane protein